MNEINDYYKNLDKIEQKWRELRKNNFPIKGKDELWRLCQSGQEKFWFVALEDKKRGYPMVKTVPAYQRVIMLLEHEKRFRDAIRLCEQANKLGIDTDWYIKRIKKLNYQIAGIKIK